MIQTHYIAYACNEPYAQYVAVSLKSLCDSQPCHANVSWEIHILTDGLSKKSKQQLEAVSSLRNDFKLTIHTIQAERLKGLPIERFTHITYFRFFIADVIPHANRVFYIDTDCLVLDDLSGLFNTPLDKTIGVVTKPTDEDNKRRLGLSEKNNYFIAAPILINIPLWNERNYTPRLIQWCHDHKHILRYPDQDALNVVLQDDLVQLPMRYNVAPFFLSYQLFKTSALLPQIRDCLFSPAIVHFASGAPWYQDEVQHPFAHLWHATNKTLDEPAKITYRCKGWLRLKHQIKFWLFPESRPKAPSLQELQEKFLEITCTSTQQRLDTSIEP